MRRVLALILALALAAPACAQIYPGYGTPTLLGDGSAGVPSYSFAAHPAYGLYWGAAGSGPCMSNNATTVWCSYLADIRLPSTVAITWSNGDPAVTAADAFMKRTQVNTIGVASGSGNYANLGGTLSLDHAVVTQSSVSQVLKSYTLPASVLTVNGKTLRITALFKSVNNANAKAAGLSICGNQQLWNLTASIAGTVKVEAYVTRTALNTQIWSMQALEGTSTLTLASAKTDGTHGVALACTETATIAIQANVNTAGATDTSSSLLMVELLN